MANPNEMKPAIPPVYCEYFLTAQRHDGRWIPAVLTSKPQDGIPYQYVRTPLCEAITGPVTTSEIVPEPKAS